MDNHGLISLIVLTAVRRLRLLIAIAGLVACAGCSHVPPPVTTTVVDCAKAVAPEILPAVESALVADDYVAELTALAAKFGECVVSKAVAQIVGESKADMEYAATDKNAPIKFSHGQNWLSAHPAPSS